MFLAQGKFASMFVLWHSMHIECDTRKCFFQSTLNERDFEMCYVDADPFAAKFLCSVNGGATATKWVEDEITFI